MLPEASDRLRDELVWRLNSSKEWKQRRLVLCKEELLVALDHEDKVIDRIPLVSDVKHSFPVCSD